MNHLAHLFLAGDSDESLLGNLAGDFVKGSARGRFTPGVWQGIMEHRRIDAFTDSHPEAAAFRRVVAVDHGHYARVISDIFFDHLLASEWRTFTAEPLAEFLGRVYSRLDRHVEAMPGRLRVVYPLMRDEGWLISYASIDGIWRALFHLSRRFSRQPRLEMATHLLIDARPALLDRFHRFMPDAIAYAKELRSAA
ncbi:MAG TPA: ACP phosphodiesterase [Thermoanaerobaculia bacterium]|nr:ACP phosphodiesterase [Thermoanaerobaculia bacterium]